MTRPNAAEVYIGTLSTPSSRTTARGILNGLAGLLSGGSITFAEEYPWHRLRYRETQALRRLLVDRYAPRGVNLRLSMLRRVLEEAHALGQIRAEDYSRARRLRNVRGDRGLRGRALEAGEVAAVIRAAEADGTSRGARDAALLALLVGTGARRQDLTRCDLPGCLDLARRVLWLEAKGNRRLEAALLPAVASRVQLWLAARGQDPGPLFYSIDRLGRLRGRLSPAAVCRVCHVRAADAGVRDFTPHDLRRSFAAGLLDSGVDLHVVQEILDHADIATTARYDPRRGQRRRAALERLRLPFA